MTFHVSVHQRMGVCFHCLNFYAKTFACEHMIVFLLGRNLWEELLNHIVSLLKKLTTVSRFAFPPATCECANFSTLSPTLVITCLLIRAILVGLKCYLTVLSV